MSSETIYRHILCMSVTEYDTIDHITNSNVTMKSEEKSLKQRLIEYKEKNPTDKVIKDKKLLQEVLDYPIDLPVKQKISAIILGYTKVPLCECGNHLKWNSKRKPPVKHGTVYGGWLEFCSRLCMQTSPSTVAKRKKTNQKRFGEDSWAKSEVGRKALSAIASERTEEEKQAAYEKARQTHQLKHGVNHYSQTQEYLDRRAATILKQTGGLYTNYFQDIERLKQANLEKYGETHYNKTPEGRAKLSQNNGMKRPEIALKSLTNRVLKRLDDHKFANLLISKDWFNMKVYLIEIMEKNGFKYRQELCKHLLISYPYLNSIMRTCDMRDMYINHGSGSSYKETVVYQFVKSLGVTVIDRDRTILNGLEIDILCHDHKLGIEFDGMRWHSVLCGKDRNFHLNKTELMEEKGYQLLHIFESEWDDPVKQEIWKSIIKAKFGIFDERVYARKCLLVEVESKVARQFFDENHLAGFIPARHYYGLQYNDQIVSMISFGPSRFAKNENEIYRFASLKGHSVIGAFGKFVSNLKLHDYVLFADRRFSGPDCVYSKFFSQKKILPPIWYGMEVGSYEPKNRLNFTKQKLMTTISNYDESISPIDNMLDNGYNMIYDCGNWKFFN